MEKSNALCCFLICRSCKFIEFPACSHGILNNAGECPASKCHMSTHQFWQCCRSCKLDKSYNMHYGYFLIVAIQFAKEMMVMKVRESTVLIQCKGCAFSGFVGDRNTGLYIPQFINGQDNHSYREFYNCWPKDYHRVGCSMKDFGLNYCMLSMEQVTNLANKATNIQFNEDAALVRFHPSSMRSYAPNATAVTAAAGYVTRQLSDVLDGISVFDATFAVAVVGLVSRGVAEVLDELVRSFQSVAARRESTHEDIEHLKNNMATFVSFVESGQLTAAENATARNDIRVQWTTILRSNRDRKFGEWEWNQLNELCTILISMGIRIDPLPPYKASILKIIKRNVSDAIIKYCK